MSDCPCCSNTLLRQLRSHQVVWFCRHCWQEMPNVSEMTGATTGAMARHSRPARTSAAPRSAMPQFATPQFATPQFAALVSLQHHPLAAAYLTPSMPSGLAIAPTPARPTLVAPVGLSLVPDISPRSALATA
jgi:hypothetical protein